MAAAVIVNTPNRHIAGDLAIRFYTLNISSADTLTVPQHGIFGVYGSTIGDGYTGITAVTVAETPAGAVITFTTNGHLTNCQVMVVSRVG